MIGLMLTDRVTLRKPASRTGRNEIVYSEVTDSSGGTLYLNVKMDRRARRIRNRDGSEIVIDSSMVYIRSDYPALRDNWLIVDAEGRVYRVLEIADDTQYLAGTNVATVNLTMTRQATPVDSEGDNRDHLSIW